MTIKMDEDEQAGYEILAAEMPADLATDIVKHRRQKKARLTARIARSLMREYKAYGNIEKAAEIHLARAWTFFEAAWVTKAQRYTDQNHPTPRESVFNRHQRECREAIQSKLNGDHGNDQYGSSGPAFDLESGDYRAH